MKTHSIVLLATFFANVATAATANTNTVASTPKRILDKTTSPVSTNVIPVSVFVVPQGPGGGRDPFFPNSRRFVVDLGTTNAPEAVKSTGISLVLQGISGPANGRLAIINGRTLAEGEQTELVTSGVRVLVRCVQIKDNSAVVEVGGAERELRLRTSP